jgi:uncharacterized membrane protein
MTPKTKNEFLTELERRLPRTINKAEILKEWELHFEEALTEYPEEVVLNRIGDPAEIANAYREITPVHKNWIVPFFIGCNSLFFIIGSLLTLAYHVTDFPFAQIVWSRLVSVAPFIMGGYLLFWVFLGFEIGKSYGVKGNKLLTKTVLLSMLPNVTLMVLTLYKWIPTEVFSPLLTPMFVILCILFTFLVYPISCLAYKMGLSRSL